MLKHTILVIVFIVLACGLGYGYEQFNDDAGQVYFPPVQPEPMVVRPESPEVMPVEAQSVNLMSTDQAFEVRGTTNYTITNTGSTPNYQVNTSADVQVHGSPANITQMPPRNTVTSPRNAQPPVKSERQYMPRR